MLQRSQDFVASAETSLLACRLQWDALERSSQALLWKTCATIWALTLRGAGKLSQVNRIYAAAWRYHLAFFALSRNNTRCGEGCGGMINPMLSYYSGNTRRESPALPLPGISTGYRPFRKPFRSPTTLYPELRQLWYDITVDLAKVNPELSKRIA